MEDDFNKTKIKWKTNQSTKINLIGCDTIVNSPSSYPLLSQAPTPVEVELGCDKK